MDQSNPYVGLRPFDTDESLLFFGRSEQTLELLQGLHQHHFVAVVGSSGSGKSSLIRAGLIPALKAGYLVDDSDKWFISQMKPGQNPIYNLVESVVLQINPQATPKEIAAIEAQVAEDGADAILKLLSPSRSTGNTNYFILIDQFEELFRFAMEQNDAAKRDAAIDFVNIFLELSSQKVLPVFVVITMRSDFIGDCAQFYGLPEAMNKSQYLVPKLNRLQLKNAIEGPAKLYNGKINPALTSRLLNELMQVKDQLPLMQHALMRIWDFEKSTHQNSELDLNDYKSIGGIDNALNNHADEALAGLTETEFGRVRELFQALTAIDENGRKIRRPATLSQLSEICKCTDAEILKLLDRFIRDRRNFIVITPVGNSSEKIIDISHESLIRQWKQLGDWVEDENESASVYLQLAEAAEQHKKKRKDLLSGSELSIALEWRNTFNPTAVWANRYREGFDSTMGYLVQSEAETNQIKAASIARKKKQRILTITVVIILAIAAVFSGAAAIYASTQSIQAKNSADTAQKALFAANCNLTSIDSSEIFLFKEKAQKFYEYGEYDLAEEELKNAQNIYKKRLSLWSDNKIDIINDSRSHYKSQLSRLMGDVNKALVIVNNKMKSDAKK